MTCRLDTMTDRQKIFGALMGIGRQLIIEAHEIGSCLASTAIAQWICRRYGIPCEPLAVRVRAMNPMYQMLADSGLPEPESCGEREHWGRMSAYTYQMGFAKPGEEPPRDEEYVYWHGHLGLYLCDTDELLDLALDQIWMPDAGVRCYPLLLPEAAPLRTGGTVTVQMGRVRIRYTGNPDDRSYLTLEPFQPTEWLATAEEVLAILRHLAPPPLLHARFRGHLLCVAKDAEVGQPWLHASEIDYDQPDVCPRCREVFLDDQLYDGPDGPTQL